MEELKLFAEKPSSEWKTERVKEDASIDSEDGEEDDDKLPCVIGESEGDCIWRGSQRSVKSSFHRQGAAFRKKRSVIFKEDRVGGRARVTIDKERVLWQGWTEIKLWRYWGWFVVRTLYVRERSLRLMRSFILSQCRDLKTGVMWEILEFWWQHEQESSGCSGVLLSETVEDYSTVSCSSQV